MKQTTQEELNQFTETVGKRLDFRLKGVSLSLLDIGLKRGDATVLTPGVDVLVLVGWVTRPATGEMKDFSIRIGASIGATTDVESIDPLCQKIVENLVRAFYPTVASA